MGPDLRDSRDGWHEIGNRGGIFRMSDRDGRMSGVARLQGTGGVLAAVVTAFVTGAVWAGPQVEVFTPQGQAKGVRQVAVRFTEPMVAFGDPRLPEPFDVRCEGDPARIKGKGRGADTRNWVYDFEQDLP